MRHWVFILFGLCFLLVSSITSRKFMPRSSRERTIAIVLISFLVLLAAWALWQRLPYYSQQGAARVSQPAIPEYAPLRPTPVSKATPTPQEAARSMLMLTATPMHHSEVVTIMPADPKVVTIKKPISMAVRVLRREQSSRSFRARATRFASATTTARTTIFQSRPLI
jgi:hypothetical protein